MISLLATLDQFCICRHELGLSCLECRCFTHARVTKNRTFGLQRILEAGSPPTVWQAKDTVSEFIVSSGWGETPSSPGVARRSLSPPPSHCVKQGLSTNFPLAYRGRRAGLTLS